MKDIKEKVEYCLNCKIKPCSNKGCPLENDIPSFIKLLKEGNYRSAYNILSQTTVLEAVCGRICPHTKQCEGSCIRGIKSKPVSIGELEAFIGDISIKEKYEIPKINLKKDKKIAIIGGGPAGLTASAFLLRNGYSVTLYEKYEYLGGLLIHGIPEFRLSKNIVKETVKKIIDMGLDVKYNMELGKNLDLFEIEKKYDAIFLAIGANVSVEMGVEGEGLKGVYGGNQLLEKGKHPEYHNKEVAVIGGGNVAMDCARTIKKLGAKDVYVIYRRAEEQMPAEEKEVKEAKEEGIKFLFQTNLVKIHGKQEVEQIELIKTELVLKEGENREVPVNIKNSNFSMNMDYVVMALGSKPEEFVSELGIELNYNGRIKVDENNRTSNSKIFAGGDIAGFRGTVAWASKSGRDAAYSIMRYLEDN